MKRRKFILLIILCGLVFLPTAVEGKLGVGVTSGKIIIDDKLKPGMIYNLPPLTVLNTGDEVSEYEVGVAYHEKQKELMPPKDWFSFSPTRFRLSPGKGQKVDIKLNLSIRTEPGNYFAYLEGYPLKKSETGQTSIGIAAATKLYFTVLPANFILAIYYKIISLWNIYQPWSSRLAIIAGILGIYYVLHRFLDFKISFGK